jgi:hypothetical protein
MQATKYVSKAAMYVRSEVGKRVVCDDRISEVQFTIYKVVSDILMSINGKIWLL